MKHKKVLYLSILIIFILGIFVIQIKDLKADWYITPASSPVSTDTEYCFGLDIGSDGVPAGYTGELEFASGYDLSDLLISDTEANSEIVIHIGTTTCSGGTARVTEATPTADNDRDAASVSGQKLSLTFEDALAGSSTLSIEFRTQSGTSVVTPSSAGNYFLILRVLDGSSNIFDVQGTMLYVGDLNKVDISAEVDPSLTLTLSSTSCDLGTFSASNIQTCQYNTTVSTNASSGYTAYIKDDGNLRNATNDIDDVAGGTTDYGSEEYGMSTSESDSVDITATNSSATCTSNDGGTTATNAQALTTSDQSYATESGPIDSDVVTLCHSASISGTTPAGVYSHTVTITVVGNF